MPDLIDRDELKERLKWGWVNGKFVLRTIDEMPTAGTWISVKDALPETDHGINDGLMSSKLVLVYGCAPHSKDRVIGVAWYLRDPNDKDWDEWDGVMMNMEEAMYCDITHWALIPEPPKEEDNADD